MRRLLVPAVALPLALAIGDAGSASGASYYLDGLHGSDSNPGTKAAPFKDFWALNNALKPGDFGYVAPGLYTTSFWITASGVPGHPVHIVGDATTPPKVWTSTGTTAIQFARGTGYVRVSGFDVKATAPNASGIWMPNGVHHIKIAHNNVHDCSAAGIGAIGADYLTIKDNIVRGNAKTSAEDASGIDLYQLTNIDGDTTSVHNIVSGNVVYNNANLVGPAPGIAATDGNGIIVDDSRHTQNGDTAPAYRGITLIENNVVFNNGGRGIHIYESDGVEITGNTVALNNWQSANYTPGEVMAVNSGGVTVYNNILIASNVSRHYGFSTVTTSGSAILADYNLTYGGAGADFLDPTSSAIQSWGVNNRLAAPALKNLATTASTADFRPLASSPALAMGIPSQGPKVDILGVARTPTMTVGAYQNPAP